MESWEMEGSSEDEKSGEGNRRKRIRKRLKKVNYSEKSSDESEDDKKSNKAYSEGELPPTITEGRKGPALLGVTRVKKYFEEHGWFEGKVKSFCDPYYKVEYDDGDGEEMSEEEVTRCIRNAERQQQVMQNRAANIVRSTPSSHSGQGSKLAQLRAGGKLKSSTAPRPNAGPGHFQITRVSAGAPRPKEQNQGQGIPRSKPIQPVATPSESKIFAPKTANFANPVLPTQKKTLRPPLHSNKSNGALTSRPQPTKQQEPQQRPPSIVQQHAAAAAELQRQRQLRQLAENSSAPGGSSSQLPSALPLNTMTNGPRGLNKRPRPGISEISGNTAAEERKMVLSRILQTPLADNPSMASASGPIDIARQGSPLLPGPPGPIGRRGSPLLTANSSAMHMKDFYALLLSWDLVEEIRLDAMGEKKGVFDVIPDTFSGADEYINCWRPMCLEELKAQLINALTDIFPKAYSVALDTKGNTEETLAVLHCKVLPQHGLHDNEVVAQNNDVVLLVGDAAGFQNILEKATATKAVPVVGLSSTSVKYFLGVVNSSNGTGKGSRITLQVHSKQMDSKFRESMQLLNLGSVTSFLREFQALNRVEQCPLINELLRGPSILSNESSMSSSIMSIGDLGFGFVNWLSTRYNASQEKSIVASATSKGFTLIKGPPGTGKTSTLVGLLNSLHIREYNCYYKSLLQIFSTPDYLEEMGKKWGTLAEKKPHILVTAPSNVAVDNIILRIIQSGFIDGKGGRYNPPIIRVGSGQGEAVKAVSLDEKMKALLKSDLKLVRERCEVLTMETEQIKKQVPFWMARIQLMRHAVPQPLPPHWEARIDQSNVIYYVHHLTRTTTRAFPPMEEYNKEGMQVPLDEMEEYIIPASKLTQLLESLESKNLEMRQCNYAMKALIEGETFQLRQQLEVSLLDKAHIVFTTLNSAGSKCMENCRRFEVVVIDEAAQSVELQTLVPLQLGSRHCVLVGDPQQLPATVKALAGKEARYERSLFERLETLKYPVHLLDTQYRMHPKISFFPRNIFYSGDLKDGENVLSKTYDKPFHRMAAFRPFAFYDLLSSREERGGNSLKNNPEADFAVALYECLKSFFPDAVAGRKVGIITPYSSQLKILRNKFRALLGKEATNVELNTVDGFQGRELDIIIFSSVRSGGHGARGIGFLSDIRRMNVALTRAKFGLYVIGRSDALKLNRYWNELISYAKSQDAFHTIEDVQNDLSRLCELPPEVLKEIQKPKKNNPSIDHENTENSSLKDVPDIFKDKQKLNDDVAITFTNSFIHSSTSEMDQSNHKDEDNMSEGEIVEDDNTTQEGEESEEGEITEKDA